MKKIIILFFFISSIISFSATNSTRSAVTLDKINNLEKRLEKLENVQKENKYLKNKINDLEKNLSKLEKKSDEINSVYEYSTIIDNIKEFYNSAWDKLMDKLKTIGNIVSFLLTALLVILGFFSFNQNKELKESKKEIKQDTREQIGSYEKLIENYKKDTLEKTYNQVKTLIEKKVRNSKKEIADFVENKTNEIKKEIKINNFDNRLKNLRDNLDSLKNQEELLKKLNQYNEFFDKLNLESSLSKEEKNNLKKEIYIDISKIYFKLKKLKESVEYSLKIIGLDQNYTHAYNNIGVSYQESAKFELNKDKKIELFNEGVKYYKKSVKIDENYYLAYKNLGSIYWELFILSDKKDLNLFNNSLEFFKKAVQIKDDYYTVYNHIGNLYFDKKDFENAKKYYKKTLNYDKNNYSSLVNLGHVYFLTEKTDFNNLKKSLKYYVQAIKIQKDDFEIYNCIGNSYFKMSKLDSSQKNQFLDEAIQNFKTSKNKKENRDSYYYLGQCYIFKKNYKKSIEMYERAKYFQKLYKENSIIEDLTLKEIYIINNELSKAIEIQIKDEKYLIINFVLNYLIYVCNSDFIKAESELEKIKKYGEIEVNWSFDELKFWLREVKENNEIEENKIIKIETVIKITRNKLIEID